MRPNSVLITRPEPGASETASRVAALGLVPIVAPFLEIRPTTVLLPSSKRISAILVASGNAIDPFPAQFRSLPLLTVGAATARRAEQSGFLNVTSADGDAIALAALVEAHIKPEDGTLLLAAGRGQSLSLAARLRASGYQVVRRVVYAAAPVKRLPEPARAALIGDQLRTVLFFSAETARHFVRLVRTAGLVESLRTREAISIGPQAGMALTGLPWARIRVAGEPTQDEMLALLR